MSDELVGQEVEQVVVTDAQREKLCELVSKEPGIGVAIALRRVGVAGTKGQLRSYVESDQELADEIVNARAKRIRTELFRRAVEGVERGIYHNGERVDTQIEYSDRLLEFAARMYLPEAKLITQRVGVEVTGAGGGPIEVEDRSASLAAVAEILQAVGALNRGGNALGALPAPRALLPESVDG